MACFQRPVWKRIEILDVIGQCNGFAFLRFSPFTVAKWIRTKHWFWKFWVDRGAIGVQNLHCICGYKWENFALGVKNLMDVKNAKFNHIHSKYRRTWEYLHETMINEISPRSRTQPIFDLKRTNSNFWISDQKFIWSQFPILISCIFCENSKECSI